MEKAPARDRVAIVAAADASMVGVDLNTETTEPAEQTAPGSVLLGFGIVCLRVAAAIVVCYSLAVTAWRVRHEPQDLAFVAGAASLLAALFACLRRAELLTPDSPAGERRRVQAAVWVLSTALSCAFAYRVAAVMPPPLAVLVWCMTAFVVLTGFYLLVLCKDQQYQALRDDDAASDRKASANISPNDESV